MSRSRYAVGIDLGTTNSALAYSDAGAAGADADAPRQIFAVPQVVQPGETAERPLLPSFLYLPGPNELPAGSLRLPWSADRDYAVGEFARNHGSQVPTRLVASAKSWLCHPGVDRRADILPWKAPDGVRRVSPLEAVTRYLRHLAEAWDGKLGADSAANRLAAQEVVLTVPASFDAAARELTAEAARAAGLEHLTLLEEPQAAFYAWLDARGDAWREEVGVGDLVLVIDVGGGTTDFTLIEVGEEAGGLTLTRLAVGDHLLLGGDNMDLALAYAAAAGFSERGTKLTGSQIQLLSHSARQAKEKILSDRSAETAPVTVLGRGSRVVGGSLRGELSRGQVDDVLLGGFFPEVAADAVPARAGAAGLQEIGLPYAADAAVTRHLAHFLHRQSAALSETRGGKALLPTAVLFNGGVLKPALMRERVMAVLNKWAVEAGEPPVRELAGADFDLAVARGAAYYGLVRRGKGVRIRGGTARAYYVGVETALPAVPGAPPPLKALCVAPFGMEEGTEADVSGREFGLVVGEPAEFRLLGSTVRRDDGPGTVIDDWEDEIEELQPVRVTLDGQGGDGRRVPVRLHSKVTEVGQLELWCIGRDDRRRWKLEFNVRQ